MKKWGITYRSFQKGIIDADGNFIKDHLKTKLKITKFEYNYLKQSYATNYQLSF